MLLLYECFGSSNGPAFPVTHLLEGEDGNFYGTSTSGGSNLLGTVFKISPAGVLTTLFSFAGTNGSWAEGGLTKGIDGNFYGTTTYGGSNYTGSPISGSGTIFRFTTNGALTRLASCNSTNGNPQGPLVQTENGEFYGTTYGTGLNGLGSVFRVTTDGVLTTMFSFNGANGAYPNAGLLLGSDGSLYGTTSVGGSNYTGGYSGRGSVFKITTNGLLTTLVYFNLTNGAVPFAGLTKGSDGKFYGATRGGGTGVGTVFSVTTNGLLTTLTSFDTTEGWGPYSGVTEGSDGGFYGTTGNCCGTNVLTGYGTIFRVTTNGVLTTLTYLNGTNALNPHSYMTLGSDGNLYGTFSDVQRNITLDGNKGAIFRLVLQPVVTVIAQTDGSAELSWPSFTNGSYRVEYKPSLSSSNWTTLATNVPSAGNTTFFTNSASSAAERYYRVVVLP
jgi:uncharacterized repeat protein (TIGR03803 family)